MQEQVAGTETPPVGGRGLDSVFGVFAGGIAWPVMLALWFSDPLSGSPRLLSDRGWHVLFGTALVGGTLLWLALGRRRPHFAHAALVANGIAGAWGLSQTWV